MSLNVCVLQGKLKEKPVIRETTSGFVANSRIAVVRDYKNKNGERETDFIPIVAFNGAAQFFEKNFKEGQMIVVHGKLQVRKHQTQDGGARYATEVVATAIYHAGERPKKEEAVMAETPTSPCND